MYIDRVCMKFYLFMTFTYDRRMELSKGEATKNICNNSSSHIITGNKMSNNGENINHFSTGNDDDVVLDLDRGDPKMFYPFWKNVDDECSVTIKASDLLSYFVNPNEGEFVYHMPGFTEAVRRVHRVVGNAVTEGRYIVGATGSSQLFVYALRALASTVRNPNNTKRKPIPVVCAEPYYSLYGEAIEVEKSEMYEWGGDANNFKDEGGPYIEVVTSPNNPDGGCRKPVAKRPEGGLLIYDLAYYWPQYTPITAPADFDIMLFTMSKATGHAGSRVGWAIVKDPEIASMMMKQVSVMSIGSCQEGQLRATKILEFTSDSYEKLKHKITPTPMAPRSENLFEYGKLILDERWKKLGVVVNRTGVFSLPHYPAQHCNFLGKLCRATPAFAWMKCNDNGCDAAQMMTELKIQARAGSRFGSNVSGKFVRVSMLGSDDTFNLFLERLSNLS